MFYPTLFYPFIHTSIDHRNHRACILHILQEQMILWLRRLMVPHALTPAAQAPTLPAVLILPSFSPFLLVSFLSPLLEISIRASGVRSRCPPKRSWGGLPSLLMGIYIYAAVGDGNGNGDAMQ